MRVTQIYGGHVCTLHVGGKALPEPANPKYFEEQANAMWARVTYGKAEKLALDWFRVERLRTTNQIAVRFRAHSILDKNIILRAPTFGFAGRVCSLVWDQPPKPKPVEKMEEKKNVRRVKFTLRPAVGVAILDDLKKVGLQSQVQLAGR